MNFISFVKHHDCVLLLPLILRSNDDPATWARTRLPRPIENLIWCIVGCTCHARNSHNTMMFSLKGVVCMFKTYLLYMQYLQYMCFISCKWHRICICADRQLTKILLSGPAGVPNFFAIFGFQGPRAQARWLI